MDKSSILSFPLFPIENAVLKELVKMVELHHTREFIIMIGGQPYVQFRLDLHEDNKAWTIEDDDVRKRFRGTLVALSQMDFVRFENLEYAPDYYSLTILPPAIQRASFESHWFLHKQFERLFSLPLGHYAFVLSLILFAIEIYRFATALLTSP